MTSYQHRVTAEQYITTTVTTTTILWPFVQDYPGEQVPEETVYKHTTNGTNRSFMNQLTKLVVNQLETSEKIGKMYKNAINCHILQNFAKTADFAESFLFRGPRRSRVIAKQVLLCQ